MLHEFDPLVVEDFDGRGHVLNYVLENVLVLQTGVPADVQVLQLIELFKLLDELNNLFIVLSHNIIADVNTFYSDKVLLVNQEV